MQKFLFMYFVDFEKAFKTVKHGPPIDALKKFEVDGADLRKIAKLYWGQRAVVRTVDEKNGYVDIEKRSWTRLRCITRLILIVHEAGDGRVF